MNSPTAAVVLAGGRASRLGGIDKPLLRLGSRSLLDIALEAVAPCPTVVVGPPRELPPAVIAAREQPAGGGPAAALAAGVAALPALPANALVAVLAADLPGIDPGTIDRLTAALSDPLVDGAVLVDRDARPQYLIGVWRLDRLVEAIGSRPDWQDRPLRTLLEPLRIAQVGAVEQEAADVDTEQDWRRWQS